MRLAFSASLVTLSSLLSLTVAACTTEIVTPAKADDAKADASSDQGTKPSPLPGASKDGGTTRKPKPDAGSTGTKPITCRAAVQCLGECEGEESECSDRCFGALPDAELAELQAISVCIENSGCTDDACLQQACAAEIQACLAE